MNLFIVEYSLIVLIGLALGSFTTALIYRVPRREKWWGDQRSACPNCEHVFGILDLIPVFSWLFSAGRCRYCACAISRRYPATEFGVVTTALIAYLVLGFSSTLMFVLLALPFLTALLVIDFEKMILPDQLVFIVLVIGLCRLVALYPFEEALFYVLAGCVYGALSWGLGYVLGKILRKDALGFGDVKFFCVAGVWLGMEVLPYFLILSGAMAVFLALVWRSVFKAEIFPFGPALILSLYILLLFQSSLIA